MLFFSTLTLLSLALVSNLALAAPGERDKLYHGTPKTCTASHITTIAIQTVPVTITTYSLSTITTVATIPHSCYTYLQATSQSNNAFCGTINLSTCGPTPQCVTLETITIPCHDPCCPTTATVKTPGACISCQTGCATWTTVVTASTCSPKPTPYY